MMTKPLLGILLLLPLVAQAADYDSDLSAYCERLGSQGMSSSDCSDDYAEQLRLANGRRSTKLMNLSTQSPVPPSLLNYCNRLQAQGMSSTECPDANPARLKTENPGGLTNSEAQAETVFKRPPDV